MSYRAVSVSTGRPRSGFVTCCNSAPSASASVSGLSIRRVDAYYNSTRRLDEDVPVNVVKEAVVCLRSCDIDAVESLVSLPCSTLDARTHEEGGALVSLKSVFDVGSRRLLPFNLLRRSQVLSVLSVSTDTCQIRTKVSSKYGEEGILIWNLIAEKEGVWRIRAVCREDTADHGCLPTTLHPVHSPESILRAYLHHMKKREYVQAHEMCEGIPFESFTIEQPSGALSFLDPQQWAALDAFLNDHESYNCIIDQHEYVFGESVLVDEQHMMQEVVIKRGAAWWHAVFELSIKQQHGCWSIDGISVPHE